MYKNRVYECIKWGEAYEGDEFKFSWKISNFVISGKRLDKPKGMNNQIYELITKCLQQEPKERLIIYQVINELTTLLN